MTRSIPWPRILAEGVAIVVSILLAFGIQAWWEGRQDREAERVYLLQLRADLERAEGQLAMAAREQDAATESVLMVIAASQEADPPPNDSLIAWLRPIGYPQEGIPTMTTAQGLVGSDALQTIRTPEVRDGVINLLDQLRQLEQRHLMVEELFMQGLFRLNRLVPALSRGLSRYVGIFRNEPESLSRSIRVEGAANMDVRPMLRDPEFLATVDELWITHENIRGIIQEMLNETRAFLRVLDEALENS